MKPFMLKCSGKFLVLSMVTSCMLFQPVHAQKYKSFIMGWVDTSNIQSPVVYASGKLSGSVIKPENCHDADPLHDEFAGLDMVWKSVSERQESQRVYIVWLPYDIHKKHYRYPKDLSVVPVLKEVLGDFSSMGENIEDEQHYTFICSFRAPLKAIFENSNKYCKRFGHLAQRWCSPASILIRAGSEADLSEIFRSGQCDESIWQAVSSRQWTMLHLACLDRAPEFVESLISFCPPERLPERLTAANLYGTNALHLAAMNESTEAAAICDVLLKHYPEDEKHTYLERNIAREYTALHIAAMNESTEAAAICDVLLKHYPEDQKQTYLERESASGKAALHLAAMNKSTEAAAICKVLFHHSLQERKINYLTLLSSCRWTALHYAARYGSVSTLNVLKEQCPESRLSAVFKIHSNLWTHRVPSFFSLSLANANPKVTDWFLHEGASRTPEMLLHPRRYYLLRNTTRNNSYQGGAAEE